MQSQTIIIVSAILLICIVAGFVFRRKKDDEQMIFNESDMDKDYEPPPGLPSKRPHELYKEKTTGFIEFIVKSGPKMIAKALVSFAIISILSGYISIRNAERFAAIGASLAQGDFITAVSSVFSFGREPLKEFVNLSTGGNDYLSENGLTEFAYIGSKDGTGYAVMEAVYSTQHHDPDLDSSSNVYNDPITGMDISNAIELCQDRYGDHNGNLMSFGEWEKAQSNFLGKNNFAIPDESEWTRTENKEDDDYYRVIQRDYTKISYEDIDHKEEGQYIEGDESGKFLLRCSINWPIQE